MRSKKVALLLSFIMLTESAWAGPFRVNSVFDSLNSIFRSGSESRQLFDRAMRNYDDFVSNHPRVQALISRQVDDGVEYRNFHAKVVGNLVDAKDQSRVDFLRVFTEEMDWLRKQMQSGELHGLVRRSLSRNLRWLDREETNSLVASFVDDHLMLVSRSLYDDLDLISSVRSVGSLTSREWNLLTKLVNLRLGRTNRETLPQLQIFNPSQDLRGFRFIGDTTNSYGSSTTFEASVFTINRQAADFAQHATEVGEGVEEVLKSIDSLIIIKRETPERIAASMAELVGIRNQVSSSYLAVLHSMDSVDFSHLLRVARVTLQSSVDILSRDEVLRVFTRASQSDLLKFADTREFEALGRFRPELREVLNQALTR